MKPSPNVTMDAVRVVERLKNEIESIELEISANKTAEENAALAADSSSPEGAEIFAKVKHNISALGERLADKRKALAAAIRQNEKELSEQAARDKQRKWDLAAQDSLTALHLVANAEKSLVAATKSYKDAMTLVQKILSLVPETDGTPHFDSPLADVKLVHLMKLELRRGGILLAAPWFDGSRDIPPLSESWINGMGWAFKRAPTEIKSAGPWKKFFKAERD